MTQGESSTTTANKYIFKRMHINRILLVHVPLSVVGRASEYAQRSPNLTLPQDGSFMALFVLFLRLPVELPGEGFDSPTTTQPGEGIPAAAVTNLALSSRQ